MIATFSIPAISTCPGKTKFCSLACYILRGKFLLPSIRASYTEKYMRSLELTFSKLVISALKRFYVRCFRIHVSGDFYSAEYVGKWTEIARSSPAVEFFCYTRSWRVPEILPALIEFSQQKNVHLWWSEDPDCAGESPYVPGVRVAFLVKTKEDETKIPDHADLVFRDHSHRSGKLYPGLVKRLGSGQTLVCPHEQSPVRNSPSSKPPLTCGECKICFTQRPSRRDPVQTRSSY